MCGIVAIRSGDPVAGSLVHALRLLEYRGYDSAGVAIRQDDGVLATVRTTQRVSDLERRVAERVTRGGVGIGHTRWATHGGVSERNAHPHRDCTGRLALVHNGIIENADALRTDLRARGHEFASDVDTEVVCHLLEDEIGRRRDLPAALAAAVGRLRGTWAIVALDAATGAMAATATGCPLLIGVSAGGVYAASDPSAIADWVDEVVPLRPGDVVDLDPAPVWTRDGRTAEPAPAVSTAHARRDLDPLDFPDFMAKEIAEQPEVAARILAALRGRIANGRLARELDIPPFGRLAIVGCGTSLNAGAVVAGAIGRIGRLPVEALVASEAGGVVLSPGTLLVAFSQSGETADVLRALDEIDGDVPVLAVTNNPHSTLGRRSASIAPCLAGPEVGVAATKTFTAQVLTGVSALLSSLVAGGRLERGGARTLTAELAESPVRLRRAAEIAAAVVPGVVADVVDAPGFLFLGRGACVPYAVEGALKLKELSYRWAEAYPAGELKHGPLALVEAGTPVIAVDDGGPRLAGNLAEVRARGASVLTIGGPGASIPVLGTGRAHPERAPWGPIEAVVPLQMLARGLAIALSRDVDTPRNLAKAVTVD